MSSQLDLEKNGVKDKNEFGDSLYAFCNAPFTRKTYMVFSLIAIFFGLVNIWTMYDSPPYCEKYDTKDAEISYQTTTILVIIVGTVFLFDGIINFLWNLLVYIDAHEDDNNIKNLEGPIIGIFLLAVFFILLLDTLTTIFLYDASINCNGLIANPIVFIVLWTNALVFSMIAWLALVIILSCAVLAIFILTLPFVLCGFICEGLFYKKVTTDDNVAN